MKKQNSFLFLGVVALVLLTGCTSAKKELGLARNSPDEFLVVKRAPLTLPPDYALRPPLDKTEVNATVIKESAPSIARNILLGTETVKVVEGSAEKTLLNKMRANQANPDIRRLIDQDNGYLYLKNRSLIKKLVSSDNPTPAAEKSSASIVNPQLEAARIKKNKAEGKPINEGVVPVIEKKKGTLDRIF